MVQAIPKTDSAGNHGRMLGLAGVILVTAAALWLGWPRPPESPPVITESPRQSTTVAHDTQAPPATPAVPAAPTDQSVVVRVSGLKSKSASVMVAVFLNADGFPDVTAADSKAEQNADSELVEIELKLPLSGMAAVAVFQDLDGNGVLTKNVVGLPTEPYGFSRNARGTFGPPAFDAAAVDLAAVSEPLQITVR